MDFVSGLRLELMYIYCKYQLKPHSSSWFSTAFAAVIVHNLFFLFIPTK